MLRFLVFQEGCSIPMLYSAWDHFDADMPEMLNMSIAPLYSTYKNPAPQWTCRTLARDAGKASSYQLRIVSETLAGAIDHDPLEIC